MTKRLFNFLFIVVLIILGIFISMADGSNCDGVCPDPNEPCCCEQREGYYLESYSCACAGGVLQWQECHYRPIV